MVGWVGDSCVPKRWPEIFLRQPLAERKDFTQIRMQAANFFQWKSPDSIEKIPSKIWGWKSCTRKISAKQASRRDTVTELFFFMAKFSDRSGGSVALGAVSFKRWGGNSMQRSKCVVFFHCNWLWMDVGITLPRWIFFLSTMGFITITLGMRNPRGSQSASAFSVTFFAAIHFGTGRWASTGF